MTDGGRYAFGGPARGDLQIAVTGVEDDELPTRFRFVRQSNRQSAKNVFQFAQTDDEFDFHRAMCSRRTLNLTLPQPAFQKAAEWAPLASEYLHLPTRVGS